MATTKPKTRTRKPKSGTTQASKKRTAPKHGGRVNAPQLGANGRRWYHLLVEERGQEQADAIVRGAFERTLNGKAAGGRPKRDRFIAWETMALVAKVKLPDARKITRSLGRKPNAKQVGETVLAIEKTLIAEHEAAVAAAQAQAEAA